MSLKISRKGLKVSAIFLFLWLFNLPSFPFATAHNESFDHPQKLLQDHQQNILALSSDTEALKFNQRFMSHQRKRPYPQTSRKPSSGGQNSSPISQELQETITTFWAAMVTIGNIQMLRALPEISSNNLVHPEKLLLDPQREWILSKPSLEKFKHLLEVQKKLSILLPQSPITHPLDHGYSQFADFHDQSSSTSDRLSWTHLLNNLGIKGIEARLLEYWQQKNPPTSPLVSDSQKQDFIHQYVESRLRPLFHTYLLNLGIQAETQANNVAWKSWDQIQQNQQKEQTHQALMRLCGNWKWIIHNHQNHGDHKTTMTFHPPGTATASQVQPTTILIHGDTVYLKWTFPQGTQEDSLLLSNRDTRLEGTFTNSLGPHGSISGQRLSPCQS